MKAIGIDIGTTTISIIMIDGENGKLLGNRTIAHKSFQKGPTRVSKVQDPERIWTFVRNGVEEIIDEFGRPDSIGMTGQMHGMLYVDKNGKAVSPLYTWQDGNGNELRKDAETYADVLKSATGSAASGYGLTTHYFLQENSLIPKNAEKMVTISDYVAMRLCGEKDPFIAKDMAASWGCYDLEIGDFCFDEMKAVGVDTSYLPRVLQGHGVIGMTRGNQLPEGIPVTASLGDNQASVLGSVKNLSNTVLVNIGTGSQVSFGTETFLEAAGSIELRPCTDKLYLMAGSGLCGGRAYAMLEQFYREITDDDAELYGKMEKQAREWKETNGKESAWKIRTTFSGTRSNPRERGSISGIGVENFHPGAMTLGMIEGILEELYTMYEKMTEMTGTKAVQLVGSGNGMRQNKLMQELAKELFRLPMDIPECKEEAAYGAALQSLASAGFAESMEQMQQKIRYI